MPQGEATHTPMGPHDYLVKAPFTGFHLNTNAPEQFASGEVLRKTGESATDVRFRRAAEMTDYHCQTEVFQRYTISPGEESPWTG